MAIHHDFPQSPYDVPEPETMLFSTDDDEKSQSKSGFFKAIGKVNIDQEDIYFPYCLKKT